MPENNNQDEYVKPVIKILCKDLTEKYTQELTREAVRRVLDRLGDEAAEKFERSWNEASLEKKEEYLKKLEDQISEKIENWSGSEEDLLRSLGETLEKEINPSKIPKNDIPKPNNLLKRLIKIGIPAIILTIAAIVVLPPIIYPASLSVSDELLDFGVIDTGTPTVLSFDIVNTGKGELKWTVESKDEWISLDPRSGTGNGAVSVGVKEGLQPGNYEGTIVVNSNGGSHEIHASLKKTSQAEISVSPKSLRFTKDGANQNLRIENLGEQTLHWTAYSNEPWIHLDQRAGTNSGVISVGIAADQDWMNSSGFVRVESNAGNVAIPVELTVSPPKIEVSPKLLRFTVEGANAPKNQILSVENLGEQTLYWNALATEPWINLDQREGTNSGVISVGMTARQDWMNSSGFVRVESNAGNVAIPVEVTVVPPKMEMYLSAPVFPIMNLTKPPVDTVSTKAAAPGPAVR